MSINQINPNDVVGLLGPEYSFHDVIRRKHLHDNPHSFYSSFEEVFDALICNDITIAIVATSNTIHGNVAQNQLIITQNNYELIDSIDLPIKLHLAATYPIELIDIDRIYAHPVAWNECLEFINNNFPNLKHYKSSSNAQAVIDMLEDGRKSTAAITGELPIKHYGLNTLHKNIQTIEPNITTFEIIKK